MGAAGRAWSSSGLAKAVLGLVLAVLGLQSWAGAGCIHPLQDRSLSDSFLKLQAQPGAADGAEALEGVGKGESMGECRQGPSQGRAQTFLTSQKAEMAAASLLPEPWLSLKS